MSRYTAVPARDGLFVVDTHTGSVTHVTEGGIARLLHSGDVPGAGRLAATDGLDAADERILAIYPTPIAMAWERVLLATDPRPRALAVIDAFSMLVKFWAFVSVARYVERHEARDVTVHRLLSRDLQRPLLSAWPQLVDATLLALPDDTTPILLALRETYERHGPRSRSRVVLERAYVDRNGQTQTSSIKLGRIDALLGFRNSVAHAPGRPPDVVREELRRFEPMLKELILESDFLARTSLVELVERKKRSTVVRTWMGRRGGLEERTIGVDAVEGVTSRFALLDERGEAPPLPLRWLVASGRELGSNAGLLVFEGHSRRRGIRYVALDGDMHELRAPIDEMEVFLESREPEREATPLAQITWQHVVEAAGATTRSILATLRENRNHSIAGTIERETLHEAFDELAEGQRSAMLLVGDPGSGKTTALARWAESLLAEGQAVLFTRIEGLRTTLAELWRRHLGLADRAPLSDVARALASITPATKQVWLLVDGLAEGSENAEELLGEVSQWIAEGLGSGRLRFIGAARRGTFHRMSAFRELGRGLESAFVHRRWPDLESRAAVPVAEFSKDELPLAYEAARAAALDCELAEPSAQRGRPTNAFDTLDSDGTTCRLMRRPVLMRLLMRAYDGSEIPSDVSVRRAMELFVEHAVVGQGVEREGGPRRLELLRALAREMEQRELEELPLDDLLANQTLGPSLMNTGPDSPYLQLRDRGIVDERSRADEATVQLGSPFLLEYLLGLAHQSAGASLERFLLVARRAAQFSPLRGALEQVVARAIEEGRARLVVDALDACDEERWLPCREVVLDVVGNVLLATARLGSGAVEHVLAVLEERPSFTDAALLGSMVDRTEQSGHVEAAKLFLRSLVATLERLEASSTGRAETTNEGEALAELRLAVRTRMARSRYLRGKSQEAIEVARLDTEPPPASADALYFWAGRAHLDLGQYDRARELLHLAFDARVAQGRLGHASEARRWLALADGRQGRYDAYREGIEEALALARAGQDPLAEGYALHGMARLRAQAGELDAAGATYETVRRIARAEGDLKLLAGADSDWGHALRLAGRTQEATIVIARALTANERCESPRGQLGNLDTLVHLARQLGDSGAAADYASRALDVATRLGEPASLLVALWNDGQVALDRDDHARARRAIARLAGGESTDGIVERKRELFRTALEARLAVAEGVDDRARAEWRGRLGRCLDALQGIRLEPAERPIEAMEALGMDGAGSGEATASAEDV